MLRSSGGRHAHPSLLTSSHMPILERICIQPGTTKCEWGCHVTNAYFTRSSYTGPHASDEQVLFLFQGRGCLLPVVTSWGITKEKIHLQVSI